MIKKTTPTTEPLANPFRPGNGVAPPFLAGRDDLLAAFDAFLVERPLHANWTITGLRGTGKTVLASEFAARAEHAGWVTLSRELSERHRDDARLADALAGDVDALQRRLSPLAAVGQAIEGGVRALRPKRLSVGEFGYEPTYLSTVGDPAARILELLRDLDDAVTDGDHRGAILFYDEAHLLADDPSRERFPLASMLAALGAVQRRTPNVRVVLVGLPTLSLNLKRARTYAERMFRHSIVENLDGAAAIDALATPLDGSGRSMASDLIAHIITTTGAYPYLLQFFGAYACRSLPTPHLDLEAFLAIEPSLVHELDLAFFDDRFAGAAPTEQDVLVAMAHLGHAARVAELRSALPHLSGVEALLGRLVDRGLVYRPTRGVYDFALPMFGAYLRRTAFLTNRTDSVGIVSFGRLRDDA